MLLCFAAPCVVPAQTGGAPHAPPLSVVRISPELAEKLLIHKADFVCSTLGHYTRIEAIVIVAIGIDKNGDVLHPTMVSGPQIVRKAVLDAVRKYKYKPYLLNGNAVEVETTVSVDTGRDHFCFSD
jgi:protein TonB